MFFLKLRRIIACLLIPFFADLLLIILTQHPLAHSQSHEWLELFFHLLLSTIKNDCAYLLCFQPTDNTPSPPNCSLFCWPRNAPTKAPDSKQPFMHQKQTPKHMSLKNKRIYQNPQSNHQNHP